VRLTRRALVLAVLVTVGTAGIWPDGAERVARVGLLAVGAAVVADLVLRWQRSYPTEATAPFAPAVKRLVRPWRPQGLTDLQRDLRLMAIPAGDRRLPRSTRLRDTCRAAAQERLTPLHLDLERPEDAPAIAEFLGPEVTAFLLGESRTAPVDQLLAAVDPPVGTGPASGRSAR
jgi:hypothetical protein